MPVYVADTNFFIQAHRLTYPLDVVPSFWTRVQQLATAGTLLSIDKVQDEIMNNTDALSQWISTSLPPVFFADTSVVMREYMQVTAWAASRSAHYSQAAIAEFLAVDEADAWLIAYAMAKGCVIITHEKSDPNLKKKIKIPDVCNHFGLQCINTIDMFRAANVQF